MRRCPAQSCHLLHPVSPRYFSTSSLWKNIFRILSARRCASTDSLRTCFAFNFCTFFGGGGGGALIRSPSASNPTPRPAVSFLIRPLSGSRIPSRPGAPSPSLLSGFQPYVERYRRPARLRSRWDGGWECVRQTWWAREASWGRLEEVDVVESELWASESGRLQTSQWRVVGGLEGTAASGDGGAECVRGAEGASSLVGALEGAVFLDLRTIERYASATLVPLDGVEDGRAGPVVLSSCSEDRTKGTRLRRMPAPKTRWSSSGRK